MTEVTRVMLEHLDSLGDPIVSIERKKQAQRQKNVFTMTSGGFVIIKITLLCKQHCLEPKYLVTILKALILTRAFDG